MARNIVILDAQSSTQKMRILSEEHDGTRASPFQRRVSVLRLPPGVLVGGRHDSQNKHFGGPHIHLKDAYGSGEHDGTRSNPLRRRVSELGLPLGVPVGGRDNSRNNSFGGPHIHSKDAMDVSEHDGLTS